MFTPGGSKWGLRPRTLNSTSRLSPARWVVPAVVTTEVLARAGIDRTAAGLGCAEGAFVGAEGVGGCTEGVGVSAGGVGVCAEGVGVSAE